MGRRINQSGGRDYLRTLDSSMSWGYIGSDQISSLLFSSLLCCSVLLCGEIDIDKRLITHIHLNPHSQAVLQQSASFKHSELVLILLQISLRSHFGGLTVATASADVENRSAAAGGLHDRESSAQCLAIS